MYGEIDEMDGPRDQRPSQNSSLIRPHDKGVPYLHRASQSEAQHANDCVDFSCTGQWTEDNYLEHTQQGQHGELKSYSSQHMPGRAAIREFDTARGTTNDGCNLLVPGLNLAWPQDEKFPPQQFSPLYLRQQPEAGIGTSSRRQNSNGFNNGFIRDTSVAAKNETWSTHDTFDGSQNAHHAKQMQIVAEQNASNAAFLMFAHHDPDSVYPNHDGLETSISNMVPEYCQYPFQPSASMCRMNSPTSSHPTSSESPLPRIHVPGPEFGPRYRRQNYAERVSSLSKTGWDRNSYLSRQGRYLTAPMQRRVSSASSQTTEATLSSAVSDPTPGALTCLFCETTFSGKFGKGNRRRHMKAKHVKKTPITCKDCDRSFGRTDALLKHSRKQHPIRAADVPLISHFEGTGLRDER
jgi:hypothetical protein